MAPSYSICQAAFQGDLATVRELLILDPSLIYEEEQGFTALMVAAQGGHPSVVSLLLSHGANPSTQSPKTGLTALMKAAVLGHHKILEDLLTAGAPVNTRDKINSMTALDMACQEGHLACVVSLLSSKASMTIPDIDGLFPIHAAAEWNRGDVVKTLLAHGCAKDLVSRNTD